MKWIVARLAWSTCLILLGVTIASGGQVNLQDPLGIPPMLLGAIMAGVLSVGLAWGDLRRRMMDVENDVRELKDGKKDKEE